MEMKIVIVMLAASSIANLVFSLMLIKASRVIDELGELTRQPKLNVMWGQTEMMNIENVSKGDVVVRGDLNTTFVNVTGKNGSMRDWVDVRRCRRMN